MQAESVTRVLLEHLAARRHEEDSKERFRFATGFARGMPYDAIASALREDLQVAGIERGVAAASCRMSFEGGYSPIPRRWDLALFEDEQPILVTEIKAILGRSFRGNVLNRIDDVVALAANLNRIFEDPARHPFRPCVTFLFLVSQSQDSRDQRALVDVAGSLRRMREDGLIDAAWILQVSEDCSRAEEPMPELSFATFVADVARYLDSSVHSQRGPDAGAASFGRLLAQGGDVQGVISGLTSTPEGLTAAETAVVQSRRLVVAELQRLALDETTNETVMQKSISSHHWLFGGQYVDVLPWRSPVVFDQYDIPLVCADGSLEIVELKGPEARIVTAHRSHWIVSNDVHAAVSQCLNYLRALDESGAGLRTQYWNERGVDVDFRRSRGTVVIGHPDRNFTGRQATREQVEQTVRSYNAHLSRLRVLTYADLLDSAERSLRFAAGGLSVESGEL